MPFDYQKDLLLVLLVGAVSCLLGCGAPVVAYSSTASNGSPAASLSPQSAITVSVSPSMKALQAGQTVQLTSMVTNTSNQGVDWTSSPSGIGEVSSAGLFTVPTIVSSAQTVLVTATSQADPTRSATATFSLQPAVSVSVSPSSQVLQGGQAVQVTAAVKNAEDQAVVWTSSPVGVGSISSTGLYAAPATATNAQTITVTATSHADPTRSASAFLTLKPTISVYILPSTKTLQGGQTIQLTAAVSSSSDATIVWTSSPAGVGSVSSSGLYTAPATITGAQNVLVTATSQADPALSATSTLTLQPSVSVAISPAIETLQAGQSLQFYAAVGNTSNTAVAWTYTPANVGSLSSHGLYNAPSVVTKQQSVSITATSQDDPARSATASLILRPTVDVTVSPTIRNLQASQTVQLTAAVTNSADQAVTWTSSPAGVGSVSTSGLYTAPMALATSQTVTVTATSQADPTRSATATLSLQPAVSVSLSPTSQFLQGGQSVQLAASVNNSPNQTVDWTSSPAGIGTLSSNGLYTAPATITGAQSVTVTATSKADPTRSAIATFSLQPAIIITISPDSKTLQGGQAVQFTASVTNTTNAAVIWTTSPVGVGLISNSGLYIAPSTITSAQVVNVTATSQADPAHSASSTLTLQAPVSVTVSPVSKTLQAGKAVQFAAAMGNTSNTAVTWTSSPAGVGSISTSGLYIAPDTVSNVQAVIVTGTSQADPTRSASATLTLQPTTTVTISPAVSTVFSNGQLNFSAAVSNASGVSVKWVAALGTIDADGLYTAPANTGNTTKVDTITAISQEDLSASGTASVSVSSGLVGWWPLNEGAGLSAKDMTGQDNNGAWGGTPNPATETYYSGDAGYFDGTDNSVTIGTRPVYQLTGPFTLSAAVKSASPGTIISMQDGGSNGYLLALNYGVLLFCTFKGDTQTCVNGGAYPSSSAWMYYTAVFDGNAMYLYANSSILNSNSATAPTASSGALAFGTTQRGGFQNLTGLMKDVRIYNRALSSNEVAAMYNTVVGAPNAPSDLQAYPGNRQVGLSWTAPNEGAPVTNYTVRYRQTGSSSWTNLAADSSTANSLVVTGLTNGVFYDFQVRAVSEGGIGQQSSIVTGIPTLSPAAIRVVLSPVASTVLANSQLQFSAVVSNALNPTIRWSALLGTIDANGLYTAPANTGNTSIVDSITATSQEDSAVCATANVSVASGLVGWWPLDEGGGLTAKDLSGQGNDGSWSGAPNSSTKTYYAGGVGSFNGTDDSVTVGTKSAHQITGPYTLSAWVNTTSPGTIISMQDSGNNGYIFAQNYGALFSCTFKVSSPTCVSGGAYPLASPKWVYAAAVFDGLTMSVYANSVLLSSGAVTPPTVSTGPLAFGTTQRGGFQNLLGLMKDVRIYRRALSQDEITAMYNSLAGIPIAPSNLRAYPADSQVALSWDSPIEGAAVTDYLVTYRQSGSNTWTRFISYPSVINSRIITSLSNGTSYQFQVSAVSDASAGPQSSIVTATPFKGANAIDTSNPAGSGAGASNYATPSDDDEFVGPFPSWLNVKRDFGAIGDGVADDTLPFQYALNALSSPTSHSPVLYVPAGTYKITAPLEFVATNCALYCSGKSVIGESPATTFLQWFGKSTQAAMFTLDGIYRMQFNRLTLDGRGRPITLVNETMHKGCCYDGSNEYTDDVFQNAAIGIQGGDNTVGCCSAETKISRDVFSNLTTAGINLKDWNALDWYVRYSTFEHNGFGVTNANGEGGAMHLDHNLFEYNGVDAAWGNGSNQTYTYNTSYRSGIFLAGSAFGNSAMLIGNTILKPERAAIFMPGIGPLTLLNNIIEGPIVAAAGGDSLTFKDGSTTTTDSFVTSIGNAYASATPFTVQNVNYGLNGSSRDLISVQDVFVPIETIKDVLPVMPSSLLNNKRHIYEVPKGASASVLQSVIDQATANDSGNRPVVHLPWGQYSINSTIRLSKSSDVQIVGDNTQTALSWTGSSSSPLFQLSGPNHATLRNFSADAGIASAAVQVQSLDLPGDRIYSNFAAENQPGSLHNLLVSGFDNTLVQMDSFGHEGLRNPDTSSVTVIGGPLSKAGQKTAGYTGLFMGASANNSSSYRVDSGGTLVVTGFWYEQGGPVWLNLNNAFGNVVAYGDEIAMGGQTHPSIVASNFTGSLTVANSSFENSQLALGGGTAPDILLLADNFGLQQVSALIQPSFIQDSNTNQATQAATIFSSWMSGSTVYTVPDLLFKGATRESLVQMSLDRLASYRDPAIAPLPQQNEDVRMIDIVMSGGLNTFDFEATHPQ